MNLSPDDLPRSLRETANALSGGLTAMHAEKLFGAINFWRQQVLDTGREDLRGIADLLGQLHDLLTAEPRELVAIGDTLRRLGAHTHEAANATDGATAEGLHTLADRLRQGADALRGTAPAAGSRAADTRPPAPPTPPGASGLSDSP